MLSLARIVTTLGRESLRIVLPSWCIVCGEDLPWVDRRTSCCNGCWSAVEEIGPGKCRSCALPLVDAGLCIPCLENPLPLDWCEAFTRYDKGAESILHAFKFGRHHFLAAPLAEWLASSLPDRDFDVIVGVPMSFWKRASRGYNQADLLARELSRLIALPAEKLLHVKKPRRRQSQLPRTERALNVRHAFSASPDASGKSVLIVDDISTTGETFRACANALLEAGASRVCAVAIAKAT